MTRREDVPFGLEVALVPVSRRALAPVPEGPLRTAGRAYLEPSPPDELHLTWRASRKPNDVTLLGIALGPVTLLALSGAWPMALVVGVPLAYVLAIKLFNRTQLVIGERNLRLRHRPLPWPGKRLRRTKVVETVVRYIRHRRLGDHWSLVARLRGGNRVHLHTCDRPELVHAIARLIDEQLGLESPDDGDHDEDR